MKIYEVQSKGSHTGGLCYHATGVVGTKFYVLLGQRPITSTKTNSVYIFDMVNKVWTEIEKPFGKAPTLRALAASCVVGSKIYIFGGYSQATPNSNHTVYNGMYSFDTETLSWAHIETNGLCPDPRAGGQMWHYKGNLYLYGGCQGKQVYFSGLYSYNIASNQWMVVETKGNISTKKYVPTVDKTNQNETTNQVPQRLCCFTCSAIENLVYIFGGLTANDDNEKQSASNIMYVLDMDTMEWSRPLLSKENSFVPNPRASHCTTTAKSAIFLTGGSNILNNNDFDSHIYMYHILERKWYRLTDLFFGSHMPKLIGLSANYCEETGEIFFLGGKDVEDTFKFHFYSVNVKSIKELKTYDVSHEEIKMVHRKSIRDIADFKKMEIVESRNFRDKRSISAAEAIYSPLKHSELEDEDDYDESLDEAIKKKTRRRTIDSLTKFFNLNR